MLDVGGWELKPVRNIQTDLNVTYNDELEILWNIVVKHHVYLLYFGFCLSSVLAVCAI